jgi:alpha-mannosidase
VAHLPFALERLEVDHGLAVVRRPVETAVLGHGTEKAAPTGQHHRFVDVTDGRVGLALMSRGLPEHEAWPEEAGGALALTLVRSVGWLSRGDLSVIEHAAGPVLPTPGAQEPGAHRCEYALLLHEGDWRAAGLGREAERYAAAALAVRPGGAQRVEAGRSLLSATPDCVTIAAVFPSVSGPGVVARVYNASPEPVDASLIPGWRLERAVAVDPLEAPAQGVALGRADGRVTLALGPWQIVTVLLQ